MEFLQEDLLGDGPQRRPPTNPPPPAPTSAGRKGPPPAIPSRPVHLNRPRGNSGEPRLVIAIDFGTTFTGMEFYEDTLH